MSPDDQRVIPQMLSRLIAGEPVPIYGDGTQTRTFLHVEDLVDGLLTVMEKGANGEVYNIGGADQITIRDLFDLVRSATGLTGTALFKKHFIDDHRGRWPDTTRINALGWRQRISLADGIRQSYADILASIQARPAARNGATVKAFSLARPKPATFADEHRQPRALP